MKTKSLVFLIVFATATALIAQNALGTMGPLVAVPSFESIGLTATYSGDKDADAVCSVRYKAKGTPTWKTGHILPKGWKGYYKGALVHLKPGTTYEIEATSVDPDGGKVSRKTTAKTWPEKFPEGKITYVKSQNQMLRITESGRPGAYHVYQPQPGQTAIIDMQNKGRLCVHIGADYVIIRGLVLKNSVNHAIQIGSSRHDIVIEGCDISGFGPELDDGGHDFAAGSAIMFSEGERFEGTRMVVQDNVMRNPSTGAGTSRGAQAVSITGTKGNHVIRRNRVYSDNGKRFFGFYGIAYHQSSNDVEIYENEVSQCVRGIDLGSFCENKRIWGNVFHDVEWAFQHLSKHPTWDFRGPIWIWRNLFYNIKTKDGKSGDIARTDGPGKVRFYNNTLLHIEGQTTRAGGCFNSAWTGGIYAKNNIVDCVTPYTQALIKRDGKNVRGNILDRNMYRQSRASLPLAAGMEQKGLFGKTPIYEKASDIVYYLKAGSPGIDAGEVIPNFADAFDGAAPDVGACERKAYQLKPGPKTGAGPAIGRIVVPQSRATSPWTIRSHCDGYRIHSCFVSNEHARISVFDLQGRCVADLLNGPLQSRLVHWNTSGLPAGHYLVRMVTKSHSSSHKIAHTR